MEQVKLTEKQTKNSLAAKKKAKAPRNVLNSSLPEYWPCLSEKLTEELCSILKTISSDENYKNYTTFGLETALREVKKKLVKFLILDDEITPRWFGKHLIANSLTHDNNIKIIIAPKLKEVTKDIFKTKTIVLCFKDNSELLDEFYKKLNIHEELHKNYFKIKSTTTEVVRRKKRKIEETLGPAIVHLSKKENQPAFIPQNQSEMETETTDDFICLKKYDEPSKKSNVIYRPMNVKQVFPNPNRKKK